VSSYPDVKTEISDKWNYSDVATRVPGKAGGLDKLDGTKEQIGCVLS